MDPKLIEHILEMSDECSKHQFLLLGSISNYHKYGYPSLKDEGGIIDVKNITYAEHVFYDDKFSKTGIDEERIRTCILPHLGTGLCILWILVKKHNCSN